MDKFDCETCSYRMKDVTGCFPCMMQILAERREKNTKIKEDNYYDEHEQK